MTFAKTAGQSEILCAEQMDESQIYNLQEQWVEIVFEFIGVFVPKGLLRILAHVCVLREYMAEVIGDLMTGCLIPSCSPGVPPLSAPSGLGEAAAKSFLTYMHRAR
ncbi:unnamed protein product [Timema podura]|uniref:Uncharacterized protein n=1 Tax=Timema podura TaxID=61482 RepID=A0ABN7NXK8_TIMPD|nr:unnamed protein product [Timema podura]